MKPCPWRKTGDELISSTLYEVELRNLSDAFVRVSYVALVKPFGVATTKE